MEKGILKQRRRVLALMMSLFLAVSGLVISSPVEVMAAAGTETVTIGDESSNTSSYYMPYVIYYNNGLSESIYTADQIGTAGTIEEIAYQAASASSYTTTSVMIYMGHTTKSTFSNNSDWVSADDLTLVYSGSPTLGTTAGWESVTLDTEFEYNGEDNLVIAVAKKASGYSSSLRYYYTSQSGSVTLYRYSDNYSNYGEISDTTSGAMSAYLPNLQLTMATCSHENKTETGNSREATCTETGYTEYYCPDCESTIVEEIDALGHDYQYNVTQEATCTEVGAQTITCSRCDYEAQEEIDALGHDYQYEVTKEATCTESGAQTVTCSRCDYEAEETISPLGHTWVWGEPDEDGVTTGTCSVCGAMTQLANSTVTIGDEASTSTSMYMPYYAYDKMSLAEMIYTADEIGTAGSISQIAFQVASAVSHTTTSLEIYMGHTSKSTFTSAGWVSADDLTLVYSGSPTLGASTGWEAITLDTEFDYNGEDNLVIAVSRKASAYTTGLTYVVTAKSGYATLYRGSDTTDSYADVSNTSISGTTSVSVPNLQLEMSTCGHANKVLTETSDATCTEAGHNIYFCPDCSRTVVEDTEDALGHDYQYEITQEPTCTQTGVQTVTCSR
ncbi:MAG: hypothetical protein LUG27_00065, partial [Clostridiales bacterium]|nr:hypothetical protein [Clostridiales bacterium]